MSVQIDRRRRWRCRDWRHDNRPVEYQNRIDPRIKPTKDENILLKCIRCVWRKRIMASFIDIYAVKGIMTYVLTIRNQTHYFGVHNLRDAINRPEGVGLLTVCNHVTTIDSASLFAPQMHFRDLLDTRNCGLWNVAREDQPFGTRFLSMICPLVKIMPIFRGGGVYQIALSNFIQRVKFGEWCHIFPEGRTYQVLSSTPFNPRTS